MKILEKIQRKAIELEGTITGEHGVGLKLREMLVEEVGESAVQMMKTVFDMHISSTSAVLTVKSTDQACTGSAMSTESRQDLPPRSRSLRLRSRSAG